MERGFKTRIRLTEDQEIQARRNANAARYAYNWGVALWQEIYERNKGVPDDDREKSPGYFDMQKLFRAHRAERAEQYAAEADPDDPPFFLTACDSWTWMFALRDVEQAYKNFFRRLHHGVPFKKAGKPRFKPKGRTDPTFTIWGPRVQLENIRIGKMGWVKVIEKDFLPWTDEWKVRSCTVSYHSCMWWVSVKAESISAPAVPEPTGPPIGVDVGIRNMLVTSDGRYYDRPRKKINRQNRKIKKLNRQLARQKDMTSNNRRKTKQRLQKAYGRADRLLKWSQHNITADILGVRRDPSERPRAVGFTAMNIKKMQRDPYMRRHLHGASMFEIRRQLEYKAAWLGIAAIPAGEFYPSTQKCSACGDIREEYIPLSQKVFTCPKCGHTEDRDYNGAKNKVPVQDGEGWVIK